MTDELKCLRCGGALEEGYIPEYAAYSACEMLWVEGRPESSVWTGLKMGGGRRFKTYTYRCEGCGRLESFAREEVS